MLIDDGKSTPLAAKISGTGSTVRPSWIADACGNLTGGDEGWVPGFVGGWCPAGMVGRALAFTCAAGFRFSCYDASSPAGGGPHPPGQLSFLSSFDSCEHFNNTVDCDPFLAYVGPIHKRPSADRLVVVEPTKCHTTQYQMETRFFYITSRLTVRCDGSQ
jgi:hypothetical protein